MQIILSINTTADQKGRGVYSLRVSRRTRPRGSATLKEQDIKEHMPRSHSGAYRVLLTYTTLLQGILEIHNYISFIPKRVVVCTFLYPGIRSREREREKSNIFTLPSPPLPAKDSKYILSAQRRHLFGFYKSVELATTSSSLSSL